MYIFSDENFMLLKPIVMVSFAYRTSCGPFSISIGFGGGMSFSRSFCVLLKVPILAVKFFFIQMHAYEMTKVYDQLIRNRFDVKQSGGDYLIIVQKGI